MRVGETMEVEYVNCNLCGANDTEPLYNAKRGNAFGFARDGFALVVCRRCGLVYLNPRPSHKSLQSLYPKEYWWRRDNCPKDVIHRVVNKAEETYRTVLRLGDVKALKQRAPQDSIVLDVGCGTGDFLYLCRENGFQTFGVELSPHAAAYAREQYHLNVIQGGFLNTEYEPDLFDIVTLYFVLDHMYDPTATLIEVRRILHDNGLLVIQVPNIESLQSRIFGDGWFALEFPRHFYHFSPDTITQLLDKMGFKIESMSHFSTRVNPHVLVSSLFPSLSPHNLLDRGARGESLIFAKLVCLGLILLCIPWVNLESLLGYGATMTIYARKA